MFGTIIANPKTLTKKKNTAGNTIAGCAISWRHSGSLGRHLSYDMTFLSICFPP